MATSPVPPLGGWKRSELIDVADRRTDRRASKKLDLDSEFLSALQEFCLEFRWPWRRKTKRFDLIADQSAYDMTDPLLMNMQDMHLFQEHGVHLLKPPSVDPVELTPVFDVDEQDRLLDSTAPSAQPQVYFMQPFLTFNVAPVPDQIYSMRISYWACPNPQLVKQDDTIPLVPGYLHHLLCKKLELQLLRFTIGEGAAKYMTVEKEYDRLLLQNQVWADFGSDHVTEYRDFDQNDYVRST
jgi:hypothetical protein